MSGDASPRQLPDLLVLPTGGTIDSVWDPAADTAVPADHSIVAGFLREVGVPYVVDEQKIANVDSRAFGTKHRDQLLAAIEESQASAILVPHGTFTMADSAAFVEYRRRQGSLAKKVVFTGAFTPMRGFQLSDGPFALGFALAQFEKPPAAGVFVSMSGQSFRPFEVTKILDVPRFESITSAGIDPHAGGSVRVLMAGGVIDEAFDGRTQRMQPRRRSQVPDYLRGARLNWGLHCSSVTLRDPKQIIDEDRERIVALIEASDEKFVVITHALATMAETQEFLAARLGNTDKEIVLTGSVTPLETQLGDGGFNLGYALGRQGSLGPGVHICLSGQELTAHDLRSHLTASQFAGDTPGSVGLAQDLAGGPVAQGGNVLG